jgi:5'-nucleotidase
LTGSEGGTQQPERVILVETRPGRVKGRRILLTNDDGFESTGLLRLAAALGEVYELIVVVPAQDFSGSGTGIGRLSAATGVELSPLAGFGEGAVAIEGPPGLAVMAAALGAFGEVPDLVVSGPNAGMNTGKSVIHSGTVGAALTARSFGVSGIALSLAYSDPWHWDSAVHVGLQVVAWALEWSDETITLNVNVPARPVEQLLPAKWARLDEFGYFHIADTDVDLQRIVFHVGGPDSGTDPTTDTAICEAGHVAITPLTGVEEDAFPTFDATDLIRI